MQKLHPSLWDSIGWNMFEEANRKNTPVLPEYEIRNIWKSIGSKELLANPGGRDYSQGNSSNKTWGPEPEKTDPVDAEINSQQIKEIEEQIIANSKDSIMPILMMKKYILI